MLRKNSSMALKLKVTLVRSAIDRPRTQKETVRGLGLRKLNQSRILVDTPSIRGMIRKVQHLVKVESGDDKIHILRAKSAKSRGSTIHHPFVEYVSVAMIGRVIGLAASWEAQEDVPPDGDDEPSDSGVYLPADVHATAKETGGKSNLTIKQHLVPRTHIARFIPQGKTTVWVLFLKQNKIEEKGPKSERFCASRLWSHVAESGWSKAIEDLFHCLLPDLARIKIHDPLIQAALSEYWALCRSRIKVFQKQPRAMNFRDATRVPYTLESRDYAEKKGLGLYSDRGDETRTLCDMLIRRFMDEDLFDLHRNGIRWVVADVVGGPVVLPDYWTTPVIPITPTRILIGCKVDEDVRQAPPQQAEAVNAAIGVCQGKNFIVSSCKETLLKIQKRRMARFSSKDGHGSL